MAGKSSSDSMSLLRGVLSMTPLLAETLSCLAALVFRLVGLLVELLLGLFANRCKRVGVWDKEFSFRESLGDIKTDLEIELCS